MTKQDIIDYVVETPTNTNPAVLSSMLDTFSASTANDAIAAAEASKVVMPAQYVTIVDADVEVTDVDMSGLENREKLLFEVLVEGIYEETVFFNIKYGDGEAHTTTNEMIGITEGGLHITVQKTDNVWKLKVTDGSTYVPGSYIIKIIKIDILDAINAYPREEVESE